MLVIPAFWEAEVGGDYFSFFLTRFPDKILRTDNKEVILL